MMRLLALLAGLLVTLPASAGGYGGFHGGYGYGYGHGHGPRHRGYRLGHYRGFRHHRHHDRYAYLAGGLVLGAVISDIVGHRHHSDREAVTYRRVRRPLPSTPAVEQIPASEFDRYYRVEADGSCWLIERQPDGNLIATEQERSICL